MYTTKQKVQYRLATCVRLVPTWLPFVTTIFDGKDRSCLPSSEALAKGHRRGERGRLDAHLRLPNLGGGGFIREGTTLKLRIGFAHHDGRNEVQTERTESSP